MSEPHGQTHDAASGAAADAEDAPAREEAAFLASDRAAALTGAVANLTGELIADEQAVEMAAEGSGG